MIQKIDEATFRRIVTRPYRSDCKGIEVNNGKAEDGHKDCGRCEGNYYVGGECNFGGRHKLSNDLKKINENFEVFGVLATQQRGLSKVKKEDEFNAKKRQLIDNFQLLQETCQNDGKNFLYGGCVGIDQDKATFQQNIKDRLKVLASEIEQYIKKVAKATFEELQEFQENWQQVENISKELTKLASDLKEEKDEGRKKQILLIIRQKQTEHQKLEEKIKNSSGYELFSEEIGKKLNNIHKDLFDPDRKKRTDFFGKDKNKEKNQKKIQNTQIKTWISEQTKINLKTAGKVMFGLLFLVIAYWWISSKFKSK